MLQILFLLPGLLLIHIDHPISNGTDFKVVAAFPQLTNIDQNISDLELILAKP